MNELNAEHLKSAIISASNNLINNKERIDALNVFPVPDGDTGSNMASTIEKASNNLAKNSFNHVGKMMATVSKDMLLGARGNSGVILSQIFKGFANAWAKLNKLNSVELINGFEEASKMAYSSVLKPIEGTILSVIRETSENLRKNYKKSMSVVDVLELALESAKKALQNTPNFLPILKEVGVVDSGGDGLVMIIEGLLAYVKGNPIEVNLEITQQLNFISKTEIYTGEFGYCTELIIKLKKANLFNKDNFVKVVEKLGNSLVIVQDDEILKIHIHVLQPGKMLNVSQKYGEFLTVKVENMTEQANNSKSHIDINKKQSSEKINESKKTNAIISCNSGSGFIELMNEYECDYVIEGGQTNNPSAQDILEAIEAVNSENIIVLPNNSNIILAAQQAAQIAKNKNVYVVPTKTQAEGITAILNYSPEFSIEESLHEINLSLNNLIVGQVTKAVKNTKIDGVKIKNGDYLMIKSNKIISTRKNLIKASTELIDEMIKDKKRAEVLVIYYGNSSSATEATEIERYVLKKYNIEVEIVNGNQNVYDFLFGLE